MPATLARFTIRQPVTRDAHDEIHLAGCQNGLDGSGDKIVTSTELISPNLFIKNLKSPSQWTFPLTGALRGPGLEMGGWDGFFARS